MTPFQRIQFLSVPSVIQTPPPSAPLLAGPPRPTGLDHHRLRLGRPSRRSAARDRRGGLVGSPRNRLATSSENPTTLHPGSRSSSQGNPRNPTASGMAANQHCEAQAGSSRATRRTSQPVHEACSRDWPTSSRCPALAAKDSRLANECHRAWIGREPRWPGRTNEPFPADLAAGTCWREQTEARPEDHPHRAIGTPS